MAELPTVILQFFLTINFVKNIFTQNILQLLFGGTKIFILDFSVKVSHPGYYVTFTSHISLTCLDYDSFTDYSCL